MCSAHTRTPIIEPARAPVRGAPAPAQLLILIFFFSIITKNCENHKMKKKLRGLHARTRSHISENFSSPIRTKIATLAHVRARIGARTLTVF